MIHQIVRKGTTLGGRLTLDVAITPMCGDLNRKGWLLTKVLDHWVGGAAVGEGFLLLFEKEFPE